jgi:hypothetical protein
MALATLPPAVEIVKAFESHSSGSKPSGQRLTLSTLYWAWLGPQEQSPWKTTAFSKISMLRTNGKFVPGLGDFTLSEQAVNAAQKLIGEIEIESLPLPTVAPISGGAIFVSWRSGTKSVEATAYHDGEILVEALENEHVDELKSKEGLSSILWWLVQG